MISIEAAVTELNAHRYNLDTGKFTVDHANFYAPPRGQAEPDGPVYLRSGLFPLDEWEHGS